MDLVQFCRLKYVALLCLTVWVSVAFPQNDWTTPTILNNEFALPNPRFAHTPRIACDPIGNTVALWLDQSGDDRIARVARSSNGGTSYGGSYTLDSENAGAKWLGAADIAYAGNGVWVVMSFVYSAPDNFLQVAVSTDNARTWSLPRTLVTGPVYGSVDLASDKNGTLIATIKNVLLKSTDYGVSWVEMRDVVGPTVPQDSFDDRIVDSYITTDGSGRWLHAYSCYIESDESPIKIIAHVSDDAGESWTKTYDFAGGVGRQDNVIGGIALRGSRAILVRRLYVGGVESNLEIISSDTAGNAWRTPKHIATLSTLPDFDVAMDSEKCVILSSAMGLTRYESLDFEEWTQETLPDIITQACVVTHDGGGFAMIYSEVLRFYCSSHNAPTVSSVGYDLGVQFSKPPKLKYNKKMGNFSLKWSVDVYNYGALPSEPTAVNLWRSGIPGFQGSSSLLGTVNIPSLKAVVPGKAAKRKTVKFKARVIYTGTDWYYIPEVVQKYNELDGSNNMAYYLVPAEQ